MKKLVLFVLVIMFLSLVMADVTTLNTTKKEIANCSEQLNICIGEYNRLLGDFREGTNCGTAAINLKYANEYLGEERDNCIKELKDMKFYKAGFYIFFVLLIIIATTILFKAIREKSRIKYKKGGKNAR